MTFMLFLEHIIKLVYVQLKFVTLKSVCPGGIALFFSFIITMPMTTLITTHTMLNNPKQRGTIIMVFIEYRAIVKGLRFNSML